MDEFRAIIRGNVQRVGFRDYIQQHARALGICGWVKNLPDGNVEVVAQGRKDMLTELIKLMHTGSVLSEVEEVAVEWRIDTERYDDFLVQY